LVVLTRDYQGQELCSVARTLEIIGDRWTWLIVRDAFLGITKFAEFRESLGIAPNVLTERLNRLVDEGIFERALYSEQPARYEYLLTQKGSDLFVGLNALRQWGDQYLCAKPMRLLRRKSDKTPVVAALVAEGSPALANDDIELVPGPGFPYDNTESVNT
jgi:DNA-binding HxlR family transcriptional regulator